MAYHILMKYSPRLPTSPCEAGRERLTLLLSCLTYTSNNSLFVTTLTMLYYFVGTIEELKKEWDAVGLHYRRMHEKFDKQKNAK